MSPASRLNLYYVAVCARFCLCVFIIVVYLLYCFLSLTKRCVACLFYLCFCFLVGEVIVLFILFVCIVVTVLDDYVIWFVCSVGLFVCR